MHVTSHTPCNITEVDFQELQYVITTDLQLTTSENHALFAFPSLSQGLEYFHLSLVANDCSPSFIVYLQAK
jgi:hypothetical protein